MMIVVFLNLIDKTVFDVYDLVGFICYTAFVCDYDDGHVFLFVKFLEKIHDLYAGL